MLPALFEYSIDIFLFLFILCTDFVRIKRTYNLILGVEEDRHPCSKLKVFHPIHPLYPHPFLHFSSHSALLVHLPKVEHLYSAETQAARLADGRQATLEDRAPASLAEAAVDGE
jgi:hypothetical protein